MAIIGAKPDTGYTQFPNKIITNIEISMKAKLLWVYLYSKPTNYQFSFDRIAKDMKEGEVTIRTALKELETYGLLERIKLSTGRIIYNIFFDPSDKKTQEAEKPGDRKAKEEKSQVGKSVTINKTDNNNKTDFINKTDNTSENKFSQEIVDVMELFAKINPSIQYGNKTQRKACEDMIKRFGYEDTIRMVKQVISVQGEQYAPIATTPYKMYHKLADFKIYFDKKKSVNKVLDLSL